MHNDRYNEDDLHEYAQLMRWRKIESAAKFFAVLATVVAAAFFLEWLVSLLDR